MSRCKSMAAPMLLLLLRSTHTFAQEPSRLGLAIGAPAHAGVLWEISDRIAVRPDVSWNWQRTESETSSQGSPTFVATTRGGSVSTGVSALPYVGRSDDLRTYVVPRYAFSRSSVSSTSLLSIPGFSVTEPTSNTSTQRSHAGSVGLGAHYTLGARFGLFGEVGLGYSRSATVGAGGLGLKGSGVGTRGAVGVVLYFQ